MRLQDRDADLRAGCTGIPHRDVQLIRPPDRRSPNRAGLIDPKSRAGRRKVPIPAALRDFLIEHKVRHLTEQRSERGLVFGRTADLPFQETSVVNRAKRSWGWRLAPNPTRGARPRKVWVRKREDALEPIGLHECRHTYASLMAAAGVSPKELHEFMGHADVSTTPPAMGTYSPARRRRRRRRSIRCWSKHTPSRQRSRDAAPFRSTGHSAGSDRGSWFPIRTRKPGSLPG